jgi:hypothetical protein
MDDWKWSVLFPNTRRDLPLVSPLKHVMDNFIFSFLLKEQQNSFKASQAQGMWLK